MTKLEETLRQALQKIADMDERRAYCDMWEYKYGQNWDEEDAIVDVAIKAEAKEARE
jgi:hypothetical protein